ncbi:hypothetical protein KJ966_25060 [bacterium]|nr:hypothetical protein [bacterium]
MKKKLSIVILIIFFFQIGYLSYYLPQIILTGKDFPPEIKLSAIIAGICLGVLLFLKGYTSPFK